MIPQVPIPKELFVVYIRDVLLPGSDMTIPITTSQNLKLAKDFILEPNEEQKELVIGVFPHTCLDGNGKIRENTMGTAALVVQFMTSNWPKPCFILTVLGLCRITPQKQLCTEPVPMVLVSTVTENEEPENDEFCRVNDEFKKLAAQYLDTVEKPSIFLSRLKRAFDTIPTGELIDLLTPLITTSAKDKLDILTTLDLTERAQKIIFLLKKLTEDLAGVEEISPYRGADCRIPRRVIDPRTILSILPPPKLSSISNGGEPDSITKLENKLKKLELPQQVAKVVFRDLKNLRKMSPFAPELTVLQNYLELIADLPWNVSSNETISISKAKEDLDADHYGMEKLKRRVLEYLAVRQLKNNLRGPILCFVGPPGVGKTSIGRSIAATMGRQFHRISLGGVCNQSDIRGHRRTYVGAMPGRIIQAIRTVGVNNPVILLDEIDKLGNGSHGDPGAALLEVLDPEQNHQFVDHFLNVPFDLSQVIFIATANRTKTIPPALFDRMEVIPVSGYSEIEKLNIAVRHLFPKQLLQHGLTEESIMLPEDVIKEIIASYTQEAGVRNLERRLAAVCRAVAVRVAEGSHSIPVVITPSLLIEILGPSMYENNELWGRIGIPGVAVGLAWTPVGGTVMIVEATKISGGSGDLALTGHLGSVLQESAKLALNWLRTVSNQYGLTNGGADLMADTDVHIHFPAGAVGKDGPSAGVTIATALMSLFKGIPVASDLALTGEITLMGSVLPVGGIKSKVLAAHSVGIRRIILPKNSEKALADIPQHILSSIEIILVRYMDEVLDAAFNGQLVPIGKSNTVISKL